MNPREKGVRKLQIIGLTFGLMCFDSKGELVKMYAKMDINYFPDKFRAE